MTLALAAAAVAFLAVAVVLAVCVCGSRDDRALADGALLYGGDTDPRRDPL